ncbi:MAG TPA: flagellar motor switch protein FliN [Haliangiales bacterium]|nr:flagellar motor switch protein FliN [Haliangiales bacterium]
MKEDTQAGEAGSFQNLFGDVPVELSVELGRVTMSLKDLIARLGPGSVIPLTKLTGEKLDVRINERLVARAEAVAIGERYGVRIVEIIREDGGKVS